MVALCLDDERSAFTRIERTYVAARAAVGSGLVVAAVLRRLVGGPLVRSLLAAGSLITLYGENLAPETVSVPADSKILPRSLGGVRLYFDGIEAPLLLVSPTQINAQIPWEVGDATNVNAYVRIERAAAEYL